MTDYHLVAIGSVFIIIGLLFDFKPWKWAIFHRKPVMPRDTDGPYTPSGPAKTERETWDGMFRWLWQVFGEVESHGKPDEMPKRDRLEHFAEWPAIAELSCQLFAHQSFTRATWDRLKNWLCTQLGCHAGGNMERLLTMQRSKVVVLLREAVTPRKSQAVNEVSPGRSTVSAGDLSTIDGIRQICLNWRKAWIPANNWARMVSKGEIPYLWNAVRNLGLTPPPMPEPFKSEGKPTHQQTLDALDVLIRWCDEN